MRYPRLLASALLLLTTALPIWANDIQLISRSVRANIAWEKGSVDSDASNLSADGRFAVFTTRFPINSQDINAQDDVILFDRATGEITLVSRAEDNSDGAAGVGARCVGCASGVRRLGGRLR